jgi:hypothetical protein
MMLGYDIESMSDEELEDHREWLLKGSNPINLIGFVSILMAGFGGLVTLKDPSVLSWLALSVGALGVWLIVIPFFKAITDASNEAYRRKHDS